MSFRNFTSIIGIMLLSASLVMGQHSGSSGNRGSKKQPQPSVAKPEPPSPPQIQPPSDIIEVQGRVVELSVDYTKVYSIKVAPGFLCYLELPDQALNLLVGYPDGFLVYARELGQYAEAAGANLPTAVDNKTVIISPKRVESLIPDHQVESGVTIPLMNGNTIKLRLRNAVSPRTIQKEDGKFVTIQIPEESQSIYNVKLRDPKTEAELQAKAQAQLVASQKAAKRAQNLKLSETTLAGALTTKPASFGAQQQLEKAQAGLLVLPGDEFVAAAVWVELKQSVKKAPVVSAPAWSVGNEPIKPQTDVKGFAPVNSPNVLVTGGIFPKQAGSLSVTFQVDGKAVSLSCPFQPVLQAPPSPPESPIPPPVTLVAKDNPKPSDSTPLPKTEPLGPSRFEYLQKALTFSAPGVISKVAPQVTLGLAGERNGDELLAFIFVKPTSTTKPVSVGVPYFRINGKLVIPSSRESQLPSKFGVGQAPEQPVGSFVFSGIQKTGPLRLDCSLLVDGQESKLTLTVPVQPLLVETVAKTTPGPQKEKAAAGDSTVSERRPESNPPDTVQTKANPVTGAVPQQNVKGGGDPGGTPKNAEVVGAKEPGEARPDNFVPEKGPEAFKEGGLKENARPATLIVNRKDKSAEPSRKANRNNPPIDLDRELLILLKNAPSRPIYKTVTDTLAIKVLLLETLPNQTRLIIEVVNVGVDSISHIEVHLMEKVAGSVGTMLATRYEPPFHTASENELIGPADYGRFAFLFNRTLPTGKQFELRWKTEKGQFSLPIAVNTP